MTDPNDDAGPRPGRGSTSGAPRWVKVFGIVALVLGLLFAILMLTGRGGDHGPGRHTGGADSHTPLVQHL